MTSNPKVSVVIVTYNSKKYISKSINSILNSDYPNKEILVLDNNSGDSTQEILKLFNNKVDCIFSSENMGYAKANNVLIDKAKGDFIYIMNPDTIVTKKFLLPLVNQMISDNNTAACQPAVYLTKNKSRLNLTGKVTHILGFDWIRDYNGINLRNRGEIDSFSGCGVLVNKKLFKIAGGFDPYYFMYYEDSDLSWRLRLMGKKLFFIPDSKIYHDYKFIPDENIQKLKLKMYYIERNRLIDLIKNYRLKTLLILLPLIIWVELGMIFYSIFKGFWFEKIKSYMSIVSNFPYILTQRNLIKRTVKDRELMKNYQTKLTFVFFETPMVRYLVNPVVSIYWYLVRGFV